MSNQDTNKLVLLLTRDANHDTSTVGFTIANAALSQGKEVAIFLTSDGVDLAREGANDLAEVRPFRPLAELVEDFVSGGGLVWVCSPCFQHRGHRPDDLRPGVTITGAGPMLEWIGAGAATLSL